MAEASAHNAGDVLSELTITPTRTDFVRFAGAGGDFNPVHHDEPYAQALGHPSVFAMGMWTASVAARVLTDYFGHDALRGYSVRFAGLVWPDAPLQFRALIDGKRATPSGEILDVSVTVEGAGEVKLKARAAIACD